MARSAILCLTVALCAVAAVSAQNVPVTPQRSTGACSFDRVQQAIAFALRNRESLTDFRSLVEAATDIGTTQRPTEAKLTIFAPTDAALAGEVSDPDGVQGLLDGRPGTQDEINRLVRTHITNSGAFSTKTLREGQVLQTEEPQTQLTVNVEKDSARNGGRLITIIGPNAADNRAPVVDPRNIKACKSFIHAIDEAITPRDA